MIDFSERRDIAIEQIIPIYELNGWSSAQKPEKLHQALLNSHHLVSAWQDERLVGIGNSISDGFLVVYYPHLLVHPDYQGQGIGRKLVEMLKQRYGGFHMHMLVADNEAIAFYENVGLLVQETRNQCGFTADMITKYYAIVADNAHYHRMMH